MRIAAGSDLHLEMNPLTITSCDAEVVFLCGDIGTGVDGVLWAIEQFNKFPNVKKVLFVPGNHDFFGCHNFYEHIEAMKRAAKFSKVEVMYNDFIDYKGFRFIGSTLWTDFKLNGNQTIGMINAMALDTSNTPGRIHKILDFDKIVWEDGNFITTENMLSENQKASNFIFDNLSKDATNIVLTHFPPAGMISFRGGFNINDPTAPYFANTLDNYIGYSNIHYWFYGHNHDNAEFEIGDTNLIGWMRGYRSGEFELHEMEV